MQANTEGFPATSPERPLPGVEAVTSPFDVGPVLDSLEAAVQESDEGTVIPHEKYGSFYHS